MKQSSFGGSIYPRPLLSAANLLGPCQLPLTKRDIRQRLFDKEQLLLFSKLASARPQIHSQHNLRRKCESSLSSQSRRLKQRQMKEDRQIQIEHENRRLLQNISRILKRNPKQQAQSSRVSSASSRRSLNSSARKQENARIEKENRVSYLLLS